MEERKEKPPVIYLRVTPAIKERIDRIANHNHQSINYVGNLALSIGLDQLEKDLFQKPEKLSPSE